MKRRILSLLMVVCMLTTMLTPVAGTFATSETNNTGSLSGVSTLSTTEEEASVPAAAAEKTDWAALAAEVELTGNWRDDLIAIAESQLGYHEENGVSLYGEWAERPTADWTAHFINWVATQAGLTKKQFPHGNTYKYLRIEMNDVGALKRVSRYNYPSYGDLALIEADGQQLVGIVAFISNGYASVIHGDDNGAVTQKSYKVETAEFDYYVDLNVLMERAGIDTGKGGSVPVIPADGVVAWTNTNAVYVRQQPTTQSQRITTVKKSGTPVTVTSAQMCDDGYIWYGIEYEGKVGYIRGDLLTLDKQAIPTATPKPTKAPSNGNNTKPTAAPTAAPEAEQPVVTTAPAAPTLVPSMGGVVTQDRVVNIDVVAAEDGETVNITFDIYGATAYQWYEVKTVAGTDGDTVTTTPIEGATTETLAVVAKAETGVTYSYYCVATIEANGQQTQVTSKTTVLNVGAPIHAVAILGEEINFSFTYENENVAGYQWYVIPVGQTAGQRVSGDAFTGADTYKLTFAATAEYAGAQFYCVAKSSSGEHLKKSSVYTYEINTAYGDLTYDELSAYVHELAHMSPKARYNAISTTWAGAGLGAAVVSFYYANFADVYPELLCDCDAGLTTKPGDKHDTACSWYIYEAPAGSSDSFGLEIFYDCDTFTEECEILNSWITRKASPKEIFNTLMELKLNPGTTADGFEYDRCFAILMHVAAHPQAEALICNCWTLDENNDVVIYEPSAAHAEDCPWHTNEVVDTATGIVVTGSIPDGVIVTTTALEPNGSAVVNMVDLEAYADTPNVLVYDITLMQDGVEWQPETTVYVTIPGVYDVVPEDARVEVFHLLTAADSVTADSGFEKAAGVTVNADGSVTFAANGFSTYYLVAGSQSDNSGNDTFYVLRGTTVELTGVNNDGYTVTYPNGVTAETSGVTITRSNNTLTFAALSNAAYGVYSIRISSSRTATIHILSAQDMFTLEGIENDVYFTVIGDSTEVPNEPMSGGNYSWNYIKKSGTNYTFTQGAWGTNGRYQESPDGFLNLDVIGNSDALVQNLQGQNVIGVIDRGWGNDTRPCINLTDAQWHDLLVQFVSSKTVYISDGMGDGIQLTSNMVNETLPDGSYRYQMYPYVVKLIIDGGSWQDGWHIDCLVADTKTVSVTYEYNLPLTAILQEDSKLLKPETLFYTPGTTGVDVGVLTLGETTQVVGNTSITIYDTDTMSTNEYKFLYWSTEPDGSGAIYDPGDELPELTADVVLYAIWNFTQTSGVVRIEKDVEFVDAEDERIGQVGPYTFTVTFAKATADVKYPYTLYKADGTVEEYTGENEGIKSGEKLTLADGEYAIINNVPAGTVTVTETWTAADEYQPSWSGNATAGDAANVGTATVTAGKTTAIVCTNTYEPLTGTLTIKKVFSDVAAPTTGEITFTVADNADATKTWTVTLSAADGWADKTIELNVGTYTVTEGTVPVITNYVFVPAQSTTTATAEVKKDSVATATIVNTYKLDVGPLTIIKVVDNKTGYEYSETYSFKVTLKDAAGNGVSGTFPVEGLTGVENLVVTDGVGILTGVPAGKIVIQNIDIGTVFTVTETNLQDHYTVSYAGNEGKIATADGAQVTVTNTYRTGSLTITKTVDGADKPPAQAFTVKVTLPDGKYPYTNSNGSNGTLTVEGGAGQLTIKADETITITGIKIGSEYKVAEIDYPVYFTPAYSQNNEGTISSTVSAVQITNTYHVGNLTITKNVEGVDADNLAGEVFTFTVKNAKGDTVGEITLPQTGNEWSYTINNLPVGEYTVTETTNDIDNYTQTAVTANGNPGNIATVTVKSGETAAAAFINEYTKNTADLIVTKEVVAAVTGTSAPEDDTFTIRVTFTPKADSEYRLPTQYRLDDGDPQSLTLVKDEDTDDSWYVDIPNVKDGTVITILGLYIDTQYEVEETDAPAYYVASYSDNCTGTIVKENVNTEVINTYHAGSLTISKTVAGVDTDDIPTGEVYTFQIMQGKKQIGEIITLAAGENETITNLPVGEYTVQEVLTDGKACAIADYTFVKVTANNTDSDSATVTVESGRKAEAAFTNVYTKNTKQLKITKLVEGTPLVDDVFTIQVTFTGKTGSSYAPATKYIDVDGVQHDLELVNGVATFELKAGQSITILDVVVDTYYKVEEPSIPVYYAATYNNQEGTIAVSGTTDTIVEATVINTYLTGSLTVTKTVVNNTIYDVSNQEFTFAVKLTHEKAGLLPETISYKVGEAVRTATVANGVYTITLKGGESAVFTGLPYGTNYEVVETPVAGYDMAKANDNGVINAQDSEKTAAFTNTYKVGTLTITKEIDGKKSNPDDTFLFRVTGEGVNLQVLVPAGGTVTIQQLPVGDYTVTEIESWSWRYDCTDADATMTATITLEDLTASVTFTNKVIHDYWLDGSDYKMNQFTVTK